MTQKIRLQIEPPKRLTSRQELALLRAAVARRSTPHLKRRLASLAMIADAYDEAIRLLEECAADAPDSDIYRQLAASYLAKEDETNTRRAREAALKAVELSSGAPMRAAALAALGKALARLGEDRDANEAFEAALAANPFDKDACKRLVALHFKRNDARAVLSLFDRLQAFGVGHSRLLAARTLALARLGRIDEARAFENLGWFSHRTVLEPPPGWATIGAFNAALANELSGHPALRYERYGTASTKTWRIDDPAAGGSRLLAALYGQMQSLIGDFMYQLEGVDHPWVRTRPDEGLLHNWCVITDGPGFEEWHVHQFGWLSAVYYVAVPDAIARGNDEAGCIAFGLPEYLVGNQAAAAFGLDLVRPEAGLAMLFPSHAYHRTFRHGVPERRICLAFDLWPA
jgi:tetratricopeptide (TPR) repeat protein